VTQATGYSVREVYGNQNGIDIIHGIQQFVAPGKITMPHTVQDVSPQFSHSVA
jgi:hypothetical protein